MQPTRTGFKSKEKSSKKTPGSESESGEEKLAGAGHNGTSLKMMTPSLKKNKTKTLKSKQLNNMIPHTKVFSLEKYSVALM